MGWLFGNKKNKNRTKARLKPQPTAKAAAWDKEAAWRRIKLIALLVTVGLVLVGWRPLEARLTGYVAQHRPLKNSPQLVELVSAPAWMSTLLMSDLQQLVAGQFNADPLDEQSVVRAVQALRHNPWVRHVHRIQRGSEGQIHVHASYRQPIALVTSRDGYHLVDDQGVRLPGLYESHQLVHLNLPVIAGASHGPREIGQVWPGDDVQAGLALVQLLQGESYVGQIREFDVSARDSRGRIRLQLRTANGLVRWGLPPGMEQAIEPDAQTKRKWLSAVAMKYNGPIDANGKIVDLFGGAPTIHQPEATVYTTATYTNRQR